MIYKLTTLEQVKLFLINKKSNFIIINKTNGHTLEITVKLKEDKLNLKRYYVYLKSLYIGTIIKENIIKDGKESINQFFVIKSKLFDDDILLYNKAFIFKKLFDFVFKDNKIPNNIELAHTGQCCVCGKKLTNPAYIELGIGQKCLKNVGK